MTQFDLLDEKPAKQLAFSIEMVTRAETLQDALLLAQTISGLKDKQITGPIGLDAAQWSRIKNGDANFPTNQKLNNFLELVGPAKDVGAIWFAEKVGRDWSTIEPHRSNLELEVERLRKEVAKRDEAIAIFMSARK